MNYTTLVAQIQAYTNRSDQYFVEQIPNFINQGINKIYMEAKNIGFQKTLGFDGGIRVEGGSPNLAKPLDWKQTISLLIRTADDPSRDYTLFPRTYEFCKIYNAQGQPTGLPKFYADTDLQPQQSGQPSNFFLSPAPAVDYQYQLVYLALPQFDVNNQTNFLTDRYPALVLYACLSETIPFLKTDERIPVFSSLYDRALQSVNKETIERYTDRTSKRNKD